MIDDERMRRAYEEDSFYSVQLELGDRCEQDCMYCYMNAIPKEINTLSDDEISQVLGDAS